MEKVGRWQNHKGHLCFAHRRQGHSREGSGTAVKVSVDDLSQEADWVKDQPRSRCRIPARFILWCKPTAR